MKKKVITNDVPLPSSGSMLINTFRESKGNYYGRDYGIREHQGTP